MKYIIPPIDFSSVDTVIYHLPDGPALSLKIDGIEEYLDLELEIGHVCDTSDIDGVVHFFPRGNAWFFNPLPSIKVSCLFPTGTFCFFS